MGEEKRKLYMVMLGATPKGRLTEQHDIFFGIGTSLQDLLPDMDAFWPEAMGKFHIDAWREVTSVDGFSIEVISKEITIENTQNLFFFNLGGYKENEFEEYHYKLLSVSESLSGATKKSKETAFYKHFSVKQYKGATSHIDEKYGIDVDDMYKVEDILAKNHKENYQLKITPTIEITEDELHIGYVKISSLKK